MPRATRAALRAQELAEEATTAAAIALPSTPTTERVPLGEISNNTNHTIEEVAERSAEIELKAAAKGNKGKGARKGKKGAKAKAENKDVEIFDDDRSSSRSDAVNEACSKILNCVATDHEEMVLPDRSVSPPSPAVEAATHQLSNPDIPLVNPDINQSTFTDIHQRHIGTDSIMEISNQVEHSVQTPQPNDKAKSFESTDDSFVEQIKTRTPAKRISRIEDSVEALDALEDEIERMDQAIPTAKSDVSSPPDARKPTISTVNANEKKLVNTTKAKKTSTKNVELQSRPKKLAVTNDTAKERNGLSESAGTLRSKTRTISKTPGIAPKPSPALIQKKGDSAPAKRVSSIHKAPFQTVKSTKPPTKSTFELPGEAVARRLKEQREERQKREEEGQEKTRQFKARPVRLSHAPEIKMTAAAKARLSMTRNVSGDEMRPKAVLHAGAVSAIAPNKRQSTLTVTKRSAPGASSRTSPMPANTSAKRGPSLSARSMSRQPSMSPNESRPAPTGEDLAQQKLKGKEVFGRTKAMLSERENDKKTKEEAAKKARAEAAERGRVASREWAERQKAKRATAVKVDGEGQVAKI